MAIGELVIVGAVVEAGAGEAIKKLTELIEGHPPIEGLSEPPLFAPCSSKASIWAECKPAAKFVVLRIYEPEALTAPV